MLNAQDSYPHTPHLVASRGDCKIFEKSTRFHSARYTNTWHQNYKNSFYPKTIVNRNTLPLLQSYEPAPHLKDPWRDTPEEALPITNPDSDPDELGLDKDVAKFKYIAKLVYWRIVF